MPPLRVYMGWLGVLGLDAGLRVQVSAVFTARTEAGRALYGLQGRKLAPARDRRPRPAHVCWHAREVFNDEPLTG